MQQQIVQNHDFVLSLASTVLKEGKCIIEYYHILPLLQDIVHELLMILAYLITNKRKKSGGEENL